MPLEKLPEGPAPENNAFSPAQIAQLRLLLKELVPDLVEKSLREKRAKYGIIPLNDGR